MSSVALNTPCHRREPSRSCANRPWEPCSPPPMATSRAPPCSPPRRPVADGTQPRRDPYPSRGTYRARARCLAHAVAHKFARSRTGRSRQHRRHAAGADLTATATNPGLAPFEPSNPRGFQVVAPFWPDAQALWDPPPARSSRAAVSLVGIWSSTWDRCCRHGLGGARVATCRRSHSQSARIRCG
jgi:hypothetical protein